MIAHLSTSTMGIGPADAQRIRDMLPVPGERSIQESRIDRLRARLQEGLFYGPSWAVCQVTATNRTYRLNGQHSSTMLLRSIPFPAGLVASIQRFQCDTMAELAELHAQFDATFSARSAEENVQISLRVDPKFDGVSKTAGRNIATGLAFYFDGLKAKGPYHARGVHKLPVEFPDFTLWAGKYGSNTAFKRSAVMAAMYSTYVASPVGAEKFWSAVKEEDHPDVNNASRTLAVFLRGQILATSHHKKQTWTSEAVYRKCITAWNAFCQGKATNLGCHTDCPVPVTFVPKGV